MELDITLKELVKDNFVAFESYRKGIFLYSLNYSKPDLGIIRRFIFQVPIEDVGDGSLIRVDKAITYMRWIRKAFNDKELIEVT